MKPETWLSIYAAIIGTSAFLLNLKSWLDSGVKLSMSMIADGVIIGGDPRFEEKDIVIVSVTNRGDAATMITHLVLLEMPTWWRRFRRRPTRSFIVLNPQLRGYPPNIPGELAPGKIWTGVIRKRQDYIADLRSGHIYVGVYGSHRDKAYLRQIPKEAPKPKESNDRT
jgi:hypothetical protein